MASLLKTTGTDPELTFSYSNQASISWATASVSYARNVYDYIAFGIPTPSTDVPIGGTATYTGVAVGSGRTNGSGYGLDGTTTFLADFQKRTINAALNLVGRDITSGAKTTFSTMPATGSIESNRFAAKASADGLSLNGRLFGPDAKELGARSVPPMSRAEA